MKIGIVGAGYVGLVTAAVLGQSGHTLVLCERDPSRRDALRRGHAPLREPGLQELWADLSPTEVVDTPQSLVQCDAILVCVQTPSHADGSIDRSHLVDALKSLDSGATPVIVRSTIVPGTCRQLQREFPTMPLAHVPEFLVEGRALLDAQRPSRVVLGAHNPELFPLLRQLFVEPVPPSVPVFEVDCTTAELAKVGANVALASRVALINALTRCAMGSEADAKAVQRIIAADPRIGSDYLQPSLGFGGSCLPKDVAGLHHSTRTLGVPSAFFNGLHEDNLLHTDWLTDLVVHACPPEPTVAVWGLAFKAGVADTRGSRTQILIRRLLSQGASVRAFDPQAAVPEMWRHPQLTPCASALEAATGADALVVATAEPQWSRPPLPELGQRMRGRVVADWTFTWNSSQLSEAGWHPLGHRTS